MLRTSRLAALTSAITGGLTGALTFDRPPQQEPDAPATTPRRRLFPAMGWPALSSADWNRAATVVRAGHVAYETNSYGDRRSINPDRRVRRRIMARLGITSGRQWRQFRKAARRQAKAEQLAGRA